MINIIFVFEIMISRGDRREKEKKNIKGFPEVKERELA